MQLRRWFAIAALLPTSLSAQSIVPSDTAKAVVFAFENCADIFGSRLVAAFDSIPAKRYDYRPTPTQQTVGYIAQHVEGANYDLCGAFSDLKHRPTHKDSLPDSVKAKWPKDTLVKRLDASLRFCDAALERVSRLESPALASGLLAFETDLAEHYSQISSYMRLLGLVPPSALPFTPRTVVELPAPQMSPLVGAYQLAMPVRIDVTMSGGALFAKSSSGGSTVRLWPEGKNDFFVKEVDAQITFVHDATGRVTGLVLHQWGRDRTARKIQ